MKKTIFLLAVILYTFSSFANKADSLKVKKVLKNRLAEINAVNSNKYTIKQIDIISGKGLSLIYIGQLKPAGYILVSAAENAVPVLGGSLGKNFCMDSIAPGLRYLIKSYKEEILYALENNLKADDKINKSWKRYAVDEKKFTVQIKRKRSGHLVLSEWGQEEYYNQAKQPIR